MSTNAIKNRNNQILLITIYIVPMHVKILTLNPQILFNKIHPLIEFSITLSKNIYNDNVSTFNIYDCIDDYSCAFNSPIILMIKLR